MSRNNLTQRGLVGMALVLFLGSGFAAGANYWVQQNDYVAIIDGERVPNLVYQQRLVETQQMLMQAKMPAELSEQMALNQTIERTLLLQEAQRRGLSVKTSEIDSEWDRTLTQSYGGSQERMNMDLRRAHYTPADFRQELGSRLSLRMLQEQLAKQSKLSDQELETYYKQHLEEFRRPERVEAWHILLKAPKPADLKKVKPQADALLAELKAGADFAALAKKHSQDGTNAPNGGKLEPFAKGEMVAPFEAATWKLKPGEIAPEPVQTTYGWHLIKRGQTLPAGLKTLAEARADFEPYLLAQHKEKVLQKWLEQQRKRVKIVVNPAFAKPVAPVSPAASASSTASPAASSSP